MTAATATAKYDGTGAFPEAEPAAQAPRQRGVQVAVTMVLVAGPFVGLVVALWMLWGRGVGLADIGLAVFFYLLTGFGVTVGFHRCLTHRSFTARPALRVALAIAGSMSFEGDVITWTATHRRHQRRRNLFPARGGLSSSVTGPGAGTTTCGSRWTGCW